MCMFEQQIPVNVACDKMKARPLGRETNQNAASDKISIRYKKVEERRMRLEERQSGMVNIYLFMCGKETMPAICAALCVCVFSEMIMFGSVGLL